MDNLVHSLLRYEPESNAHYHAIVRAAVAHAQFEAIHPFRDGNGRTGRLLIPLVLAADGYLPLYVSGPLHRNRGRYFDTLLATQLRSEWAGWIDFFNEAVEIACDESMRTARDLIGLRDDWRVRLQDLRADAAALRLIDLLIESPVVTVNQVKDALSVSFPAANNAVQELVDRGILTRSERRRNRTFRADDAINILNAAPSQPRRPASD
jgi:Fic family protein